MHRPAVRQVLYIVATGRGNFFQVETSPVRYHDQEKASPQVWRGEAPTESQGHATVRSTLTSKSNQKAAESARKVEEEKKKRRQVMPASSMFFQHNSALGPPYRVIVDTNFINFSLQNKIELVQGMMDCLYAKSAMPC